MCERRIRLVSLVLVLGLAGSTFAEATLPRSFYGDGASSHEPLSPADPNGAQPAAPPMRYPALRPKTFDVGPEAYRYKYEEPGLMEEEGVFYGLRVGYTGRGWVRASPEGSAADSPARRSRLDRPRRGLPKRGGTMFRAEGRLAFGQVDYDGGIIDLNTGVVTPYRIDDIDDWLFEGRLLLGADWLGEAALNTVFVGLGYRYLNDDPSFDPAAYERESNYLYLPVGYQFDGGRGTGWSFGFGAEFDVFIVGNQRSHLSDADPAFEDVDNRQDSGYGYRASVRLQHKSRDGIFVVEPFIRYWDIDDSQISLETVGFVYEPANETTEYGISILWMF